LMVLIKKIANKSTAAEPKITHKIVFVFLFKVSLLWNEFLSFCTPVSLRAKEAFSFYILPQYNRFFKRLRFEKTNI